MKGLMGSLPPLNDLFKMAGMELPDYLKGKDIDHEEIESETNLTDADKSKEI